MVDDAAISDGGMVDGGSVDFGCREEARVRVDGCVHVKEVKGREFIGHFYVGFKVVTDGADVFPVALEDVGEDAMGFDGSRDDVAAKVVGVAVGKDFFEEVAFEYVDAHGG